MMKLFMVVMSALASLIVPAVTSNVTFNVRQYGAKGDGKIDDSKAFLSAWDGACSSTSPSTVYVPQGLFLVNPVSFQGPCKNDNVVMQILGHLVAPSNRSLWNGEQYWVKFTGINGLTVEGRGVFDGQGALWWPKTCTENGCNQGPTSLTFSKMSNVVVKEVTSINSKQFHIVFFGCNNAEVDGVTIQAPPNSPNTDGIHVAASSNVNIKNTVIGTGDDCIAILSDSFNVDIQGGSCGPGHGISIGSLVKDGTEATVTNITVNGVSFEDTDNGVRIKTWQGGKGSVRGLTFENLTMKGSVNNPIIIDQSYCPRCGVVAESPSAVKISDVLLKNIKGTSATEVAIKIDCSKNVPCEGIKVQDVQLKYKNGIAQCLAHNARITAMGVVNPPCH